MRTPRTLLLVAVASIVGGAAGTGIAVGLHDGNSTKTITTTVASGTPAAETSSSALTARQVYQRASSSVAYVTARGVTSTDNSPFGPQQGTSTATGTGFVVSSDGLVVTNDHVVAGANAITVKIGDGSTQKATVVGADPSTDLALLRVSTNGHKLTPLKLADSSKVQIGDPTFAIGNPFGLDRTLTTGVISATQRQIDAPDGFSINGVIQTDAALNPGNSGGPLLDDAGEVIGVNSQIESNSSGNGSSQGSNTGIGFAIPSNTVKRVLDGLEHGGKVSHAYLGVSTTDAAGNAGATVAAVAPGGPAAKAGIEAGSVITAIDDATVRSADDVVAAIEQHKPGDEVSLSIRKGASTSTVKVDLAQRPATATAG
jgi:putative serine protease PepD